MGPKLKEMDEVVKMIHSSTIQTRDKDQGRTLLVCASFFLAIFYYWYLYNTLYLSEKYPHDLGNVHLDVSNV